MQEILDNNFYDLIIDNSFIPYNTSFSITPINAQHSILHLPRESADICILGEQPYHRFPSIFSLSSIVSLDKSGITNVQNNQHLALFGMGVLVGVIDTGIDYQHPAFRHKDGTSRILSIWDQSIQDGKPPETFTYGTEYTKDMINFALQNENPLSVVPSVDTLGHGTAIASIAAGKPDQLASFSGVVPDAELVVVKLKEPKQNLRRIYFVPDDAVCFQESDVMLGMRYLLSIAQKLNRPLAFCIAMGTSQSGQDALGATSTYLSSLAQTPKIGVAVSAGNEGNKRRHYFNETKISPYANEFELRVSSQDNLFAVEIWPYIPARLSIKITSPTGESTQTVFPRIGICQRYDFIFHNSVVWINNILLEEESGEQLILLRFQNPLNGIWKFEVTNMENESFSFHSWLPAGDLISDETYFLDPDPNTTVTSPGNSNHTLTVTAYNQLDNSILLSSGRGYTRKNQITPDIAAPGYEIPCALPKSKYGTMTGTGAAAAHATGIIAMMLEWAVMRGNYTSITGNDINRLLIRGAYRNPIYTYPNNIWGYGQIDVNRLFLKLTT